VIPMDDFVVFWWAIMWALKSPISCVEDVFSVHTYMGMDQYL